MGIDILELVMEMEDTFDIRIPDDDYAGLRTVGDLHDYIVNRMNRSDCPVSERDQICLTTATFVRIRRALVSLFGLSRRSVRTSSSVDEIVPRNDRQKMWNQFQDVIGLKLPSLHRPRWIVVTLIAIVAVLAALVLWSLTPIDITGCLVVLLVVVAAFIGLALLTQPFATLPGSEFVTVGGLTRVVLQRNYRALHEEYKGWNPSDVWGTLQVILVEQLSVKPEEVTRDASFVDDLGCA
jgi:acyl carrier protein